MAPAKTGKESRSKTAVTKTAHPNNGTRSIESPRERRFPSVLIKFTAPKIEETPAKCKEKIAKSTDAPP